MDGAGAEPVEVLLVKFLRMVSIGVCVLARECNGCHFFGEIEGLEWGREGGRCRERQ